MAINAEYASVLCQYKLRLNKVANFEWNHNITECWTQDHPQYNEALEYVQQRTFIWAVEELEGLVIQCLAELSKANLAGTEHLNVEVRWLQAWVDFDDDKLQMAMSTFEANSMDNMAAEMREWYLYWYRINDIHRSHLSKIYGLTGYTGVVPSCVKDPMGNQDHNNEELDEVASDEVLRLSNTLQHMK
ncbi:hypothetical protein BKA83DRAFT_4503527 [Pisolithus microcarpus]|nr:hypothetical protein BKA83DRAFT_4503527 [Pisolithus microcarpus]